MATMSLPVVEGHNRSELFKKVLKLQSATFLIKFHIDMYTGPLIMASDEKEHFSIL